MPGQRILIVEDDDYLRKASEIALRRAGYVVSAASNGREGLNMARAERPDLVILDLLMPFPTGLDILRAMRADAATTATPVMVISNSSMQRVVDEVNTLGAEYIVKADLSLRQLAGRVEKCLAKPAAVPAAPPAAPEPEKAPAKPDETPAAAPVPYRPADPNECASCGSEISPGQKFCPRCGAPLIRKTP